MREEDMTETARLVGIAPSQVDIGTFHRWVDDLAQEHGESLVTYSGRFGACEVWTRGERCSCSTCDERDRNKAAEATGVWTLSLQSHMILCPACGNKRCPHATHHDNPCTGSNEPGQEGSRYA